jgi:hypothetical protein
VFEGTCERFGIELHTVGIHRRRETNGFRCGIDEDTDAHAARFEVVHDRRKACRIGTCRPSRLTRHFTGHDRHERALLGLHLLHELEQLRTRIALDIQLDLRPERRQAARNVAHIVGRDVTSVHPRVDRNAGDTCPHADIGRM